MKHLITNITALLLLAMTLLPAVAYGAKGNLITTISGIKYTVINETDKTAQADLSGATGDAVIPETVTSTAGVTYKVTKVILGDNGRDVEDHAFYNSKINNVRFNDTGLENIGSNAFANMYYIMYVHLPYSVSTLGAGAFENSKNLLAVGMHDTKVTEIGDNTFAGLTAITSIALPGVLPR